MPVEDTPVHPHGIRSSEHRASCHNKPRERSGYWARNGWGWLGPKWVWIKDTSSVNCRQITELPECQGCTAPKDHEYIIKMRGML